MRQKYDRIDLGAMRRDRHCPLSEYKCIPITFFTPEGPMTGIQMKF
jgi:hypothetical protein